MKRLHTLCLLLFFVSIAYAEPCVGPHTCQNVSDVCTFATIEFKDDGTSVPIAQRKKADQKYNEWKSVNEGKEWFEAEVTYSTSTLRQVSYRVSCTVKVECYEGDVLCED